MSGGFHWPGASNPLGNSRGFSLLGGLEAILAVSSLTSASKAPPRASKTPSKPPQEPPGLPQEPPRSVQGASIRSIILYFFRSWGFLRPSWRYLGARWPPRCLQEPPSCLQEPPRRPNLVPKTAQEPPKRRPRRVKNRPRAAPEAPRKRHSLQTSILDHFGDDFGTYLLDF